MHKNCIYCIYLVGRACVVCDGGPAQAHPLPARGARPEAAWRGW